MRSTILRRAPLALMLAALLLGFPACSSSEKKTATTRPTAEAAGGGEQMPMAGMGQGGQEAPAMQELVARKKALEAKRKLVAREYLKTGKGYFEEGRLTLALKAFENALDLDPSNEEAQRMRNQTASLLGLPSADTLAEASEALADERASLHQASVAARSHFNKGHQFSAEGDYDSAVAEYRKALIIMRARPLMDLDFDEAQVRSALAEAEAAAEKAHKEAEAARVQEIERIQKEREEAERRKLSRKIDRLWQEALQAGEQERFDEVMRICDAIIDLDYSNEKALALKESARRANHAKVMGDVRETYRDEWNRTMMELRDLHRPFSADDSPFPDTKTWERIAARGPIRFSREATSISEEDEEIRRRLENTTLTLVDWTEKTLDDAIRFIKNSTGVNIVIMRAVDEAMPEEDRVLDLNLEDISAWSALSLAVSSLKLAQVIEDGVVKITTPEELAKRKVVEFYNVRDLTARLNSFPGIEINLNPSGVLPGEEEEELEEDETNQAIESEQLQDLIKNAVDPAWDEGEGNSILDNHGTLIIRQTPEVHRKIAALLADLRRSTGIQVRIETRFLTVENNFLQDIGVDFRGLGDDTGGIGQPGQGTNAPLDDFGAPGLPTVLGTGSSAGAWYQDRNFDARARTENLFDQALGNPDVLTSTGGFQLQYTYLDDTQLEAILQAVQKYERLNTVSAPSLMVYNTQRANLQVTRSIAYVKDFDVEIAQAAVIADPIVDVAKEGVVLDVRPIVSSDNRFITLELRPTVATLRRPFRLFSTSLGVGTAVTFEVPELRKESLKTTVIMPDGGTLLLGGLKFFEEEDQDVGIPVLKDIPVVGFLFGRKGQYTNMKDLIILLRAKIVILEEMEPTGGFGQGN